MPELTIRAADSSLAMDEIERKLGPDALILSTEKRDGLIEIVATNEPDQIASASIASAEKLKLRLNREDNETVEGKIKSAAEKSKLRIEAEELNNDKSTGGKINFSDALAAEISTINEPHAGNSEQQDITQDPNGLMPSFQKIVNELEFIVKTTTELTAAKPSQLSDENKLRILGFSSSVVNVLTQNEPEQSDINDFAKSFSRGIVNGKSHHFEESDMIIVVGEAGAGVTTLVKKLEKFLPKAEPKNKLKVLQSDFSEGAQTILKSKTATNVTSLFRKSSDNSSENTKLLVEFDGQPEDLPKHLYKIAEVDPNLKVSVVYALEVGKSYHHVADLMRKFDMPDVYVALTKMDLFEVSTAELSAISDANRKILFFSGLKIIEDGLDFAKVAVMESFLTNLIDNESW
jgi:energy-coupling factor transporter ATP-binding protein EcfA2